MSDKDFYERKIKVPTVKEEQTVEGPVDKFQKEVIGWRFTIPRTSPCHRVRTLES